MVNLVAYIALSVLVVVLALVVRIRSQRINELVLILDELDQQINEQCIQAFTRGLKYGRLVTEAKLQELPDFPHRYDTRPEEGWHDIAMQNGALNSSESEKPQVQN